MKPAGPIEIGGGGLAGLALGLGLRRADIPVTVFEAGIYPRHRVCGEFITGLNEETVARLGLAQILGDAIRHREITWSVPGRRAWTETLPSPALGISRFTLDARLAEAFVDAGGDLRTSTRLTDLSAGVARVFATGRRRTRSTWVGLKIHASELPLSGDLELHLGNQAYVGMSKVEGDRVNVCGLFRRRPGTDSARSCVVSRSGSETAGPAAMLSYLEASNLGSVAARLRAATLWTESSCAVAGLGFGLPTTRSDDFSIGDAYAMPPPFTGNGMAMAFQSAALAVAPLVAYARGLLSWEQAQRAAMRPIKRRFRVRLVSASALHPFLLRPGRQRLFASLSALQWVPFRPLYSLLH